MNNGPAGETNNECTDRTRAFSRTSYTESLRSSSHVSVSYLQSRSVHPLHLAKPLAFNEDIPPCNVSHPDLLASSKRRS